MTPETITAISSAVLVCVTIFYAWVTHQTLQENKRVVAAMHAQTEAQLRPYVVVYAVPQSGTHLLCLTIENKGKSAALNLQLAISHGFPFNGENISMYPAFLEPIASLESGGSFTFALGSAPAIFSDDASQLCPKKFSITANYQFGNIHYKENNTIDLRPLYGSIVIDDPIAREIKTLSKSIEKWIKLGSLQKTEKIVR